MTATLRLCLAPLLLAQGAALSAMTQSDIPILTRAECSEVVAGIVPRAARSAQPRIG